MGNLRPIGSEKLQGMDKIRRIIEISRYNENTPNPVNESKSTEYSIDLADGNRYQIVKEKAGYIIKKTINESESDYIAPMKNRQYFSSYSQAFKRMNLMAKELNALHENDEGISLFNESKKYILKRKPANEEMTNDIELDEQATAAPAPAPAPSPAPAPAPSPAPAPAPESLPEPAPEEEEPNFDEMGSEDEEDDDEPVTMKVIQKLTGKLAQKIRNFNNSEEEDMIGDDVKYVINSILSALDLTTLSDDDIEEIMNRLEGSEEDQIMGEEPPMGDEEPPMGDESEMGGEELSLPGEGGEMKEVMSLEDALNEKIPSAFASNMKKELNMGSDLMGDDDFDFEEEYPRHGAKLKQRSYPHLSHGTFGESKIDKIISKYFNINEEDEIRKENRKKTLKEMVEFDKSEVKRLSETIKQERMALKFMENNPNTSLVGITNKKNLIFKDGITETKITPNGQIL